MTSTRGATAGPGQELKVHLLDVTKQELAADIGAANGDLQSTGL